MFTTWGDDSNKASDGASALLEYLNRAETEQRYERLCLISFSENLRTASLLIHIPLRLVMWFHSWLPLLIGVIDSALDKY